MKHPLSSAKVLADMLDADPVAAAQIKEHLTTQRILDLLELSEDELSYYLQRNGPVPIEDDNDE